MTAQPRERYRVTYPNYETAELNIIPANYRNAVAGDKGMQASIAWQYFKALGYSQPPVWEWLYFQITPLFLPGRPPRPRTRSKAVFQTYGCTCEYDCAGCDQGHHYRCRFGCKYGQVVTEL